MRHTANFLTAANSVKDVLKREIAGGRTIVAKYINGRMSAPPEMARLISMRDRHIHEGAFSMQVEWIPDPVCIVNTGDPGLDDFFRRHRARQARTWHRSRIISPPGVPPATEYIPRAYLPRIKDRDAYTVCAQHLEKIRRAVDDCVQKYG